MNFGLFIENIGDSRISIPAYRATNLAVSSPKFKDASLFYQDVGHCAEPRTFGIFNSTDICHFKGVLVVTFLDGLKAVANEINNRKVYYYYGLNGRGELFGNLAQLRDGSIKVIAHEKDVEYVKKKLGISNVIECNNLEDVVDIIDE